MNNFDELFRCAGATLLAVFGVDKVVPDVIFQHNRQQTVHRSSTTRDPLQHVGATVLSLERPLDGFNLSLDAADPIKKLLFFLDCVTHRAPSEYPSGVCNSRKCSIGGRGICTIGAPQAAMKC